MSITPLPAAPVVSDSTPVFNAKAFAFAQAFGGFVDEMNAEIPRIDAAILAAPIALGAANYKGEWSTLSGALSLPASVSYGGNLWLLITNTANVTADVPGVSAKWLSLTDYVRLTGAQTVAGVKTFSSPPVMDVASLTGDILAARIATALNAAGAAPFYACRAWARFNGSTGAIVAAGNVSGVTRNAAGDYTLTFATAMPDANYAISGCADANSGNFTAVNFHSTVAPTTGAARVQVGSGVGAYDATKVSVSIFR